MKKVKKHIGRANQFIITLIIALNLLKKTDDAKIIPEILEETHTSWAPKNKDNTIELSRSFLMLSVLNRAVDSLDTYIALSLKKPVLFQNTSLVNKLNGQKWISEKIASIFDYIPIDQKIQSFIRLIIKWRNSVVHYKAENILLDTDLSVMKSNQSWYQEKFQNLDINILISKFNAMNSKPTLKEITSIFRCIHMILQEIDSHELFEINSYEDKKELYLKNLIDTCFSTPDKNRKKELVRSIWGNDIKTNERKMMEFLKDCGLSDNKESEFSVIFDNCILDTLISKKPTEILNWLND
ncbi:MAG: hypothetical protein VB048_06155 [Bacteroidaceae bacterium]|nr:hypothetical protein [Bacteroidaceae bacterium]